MRFGLEQRAYILYCLLYKFLGQIKIVVVVVVVLYHIRPITV